MKALGFLLVVLGTCLAAAQGARNYDSLAVRQMASGRAQLFEAKREQAHGAYCRALRSTDAELRDGCKPLKGGPDTEPASVEDVAARRIAWVEATTAAVEPAHEAAALAPPDEPATRLSLWLSLAGLPFFGGIVCIVLGAWIGRREVTRQLRDEPPKGYKGARPSVDFGALLGELRVDTERLLATVAGDESPTPDGFRQARYVIKNLQYDKVEPLIDARARLELRFGMSGYAAILGPLSRAERNLNRAWCALVDEHWDEAGRALGVAAAGLEQAEGQLADEIARAEAA